ncbi:MAG: MCP four helix bundle domain-containing protein, partial [Caulobacteraceae bacterium]
MRITIKLKLGLAFGLTIALLAATAVLGVTGLGQLNSAFDKVMSGPVAHTADVQELNGVFLRIARAERDMILADNKAEATPYANDIAKERQRFQELLQKSESSASEASRGKWAAVHAAGERFTAVDERLRDLAMDNKDAEAKVLANSEGKQAFADASRALDDLIQLEKADAQTTSEKVDADDGRTRNMLLGLAIVALMVASAAAVWLSVSVSKGLARAGQAVATVAEGDLTRMVEIKQNDEIGDLLQHVNLMVDRLRGVVADAVSASENVSSGSQELSASSEQVSQGATEQASAAEEA